MLKSVDNFTRECLATHVVRKLKSTDVIGVLSDLSLNSGVSTHIRSDNGPFKANAELTFEVVPFV